MSCRVVLVNPHSTKQANAARMICRLRSRVPAWRRVLFLGILELYSRIKFLSSLHLPSRGRNGGEERALPPSETAGDGLEPGV